MHEITQEDLKQVEYSVLKMFPGGVSKTSARYDIAYSDGLYGLWQAAIKFDSSKGVKFWTYAAKRVQGEIIDSLRAKRWVPRAIYNQTTPEEQENFTKIYSYHNFNNNDEDFIFEECCKDEKAIDPYISTANKDLIEFLFEFLEDDEKELIERFFLQEMLQKDIAKISPNRKTVYKLKMQKECRKLRKRGHSEAEIRHELNITRCQVRYYLNKGLKKTDDGVDFSTICSRIQLILKKLKSLAEEEELGIA